MSFSQPREDLKDARFMHAAGIAGILAVSIAIVVNFVLADLPPPGYSAQLSEIRTYLSTRTDAMRIGNGLRNLVFFLLPVFAAGMHVWVNRSASPAARRWSTVGLLGAATVAAVGIVANGAETIAIWRIDSLADQPELLTMLWSLSSVLFNSVMVAWAAVMGGFSMAGREFGAMPGWLVALGALAVVTGLLTSAGISSVITGGWASVPAFAAFLLALVPLCASIQLLRQAPGLAKGAV